MQELTIWWIPLPKSRGSGGALAAYGDLLIVVQPSGEILWFNTAKFQGPYVTAIAAPMNTRTLLASKIASFPALNLDWFRAAGAYAEETQGILRLFISHHVFDKGCFFFQVSAIDLAFDPEKGLVEVSEWQRIFRPDPCIHIGDASYKPFAGNLSGGKIVSLDGDHILVAYGDHEIDGFRSANSPQNVNSPYGKIWKVAKDGREARIYAKGVRNPQGLFVDHSGRVWESEHGPQGGDELNLIVDGANYGWPAQTYGIPYGDPAWPLSSHQGRHSDSGFTPPVFAWVPSIAPSNLTEMKSAKFPLWHGDLLLATLKDMAIRRLRPAGSRIVYDERISVGERIRDIISLDDGRISVLADRPLIGIVDNAGPKLRPAVRLTSMKTEVRPSPTREGQVLFERECASCHGLESNTGSAPPLSGIAGRPIGKFPGFSYSKGLTSAEGSWDVRTFSIFVRDPGRAFPGSTMPAPGILPDDAELIFQYLAGSFPAILSDTASADPFLAPFARPFAIEASRVVEAYDPVLPGFWVGFQAGSNAVVTLAQRLRGTKAKGSGEIYALELALETAGTSTFVSLETALQTPHSIPYFADVMFTGRLNRKGSVRWELSIPTSGGGERRIPLGTAALNPDVSTITIRTSIDLSTVTDVDQLRRPRVIMFLPTEPGTTLRLEDYRVTLSRVAAVR